MDDLFGYTIIYNGPERFLQRDKKLQALGISVDRNLQVANSQANRIMFVWDSIYDIGKNSK